ncbi:MAG: hypothetical protein ACKOE6_17135, partial [Flammeovirgaceae bacterium]
MKKRILLFLFVATASALQAQGYDRYWDVFYQKIPVKEYRKGKFRLEAKVRVELKDRASSGHLWVRVDKKKSHIFLDNMRDRPIKSKEWSNYVIEGPIGSEAEYLFVGGLMIGNGMY